MCASGLAFPQTKQSSESQAARSGDLPRQTTFDFAAASLLPAANSISGLVVEYIVAIDVTQVRFPADAHLQSAGCLLCLRHCAMWRTFVAQAQQSMCTLHTTQKLTGNPSTDEDEVIGPLARRETEFQRGKWSHAGLNRGPYGY